MKILITNEPRQYYHVTRFFLKNIPLITLPLLASIAREKHEVKIIDNTLSKYRTHNIWQGLRSFQPDIFCLSNHCTSDRFVARKIIKKIKATYPEILIIVGGHVPTREPEELLAAGADYVVNGEGEVTFKELLAYIDKTGSLALKDIAGLVYRENGEIITTPERDLLASLDDSPVPSFDLLEDYPALFADSGRAAGLEMTRGCINACSFCEVLKYWKKVCRNKSTERILKELDILKSMDFTEVFFIDDNFGNIFRPREAAVELFQEMIKREYNFKFGVQIASEDIVNYEDIINLMVKAGFSFAVVGFEAYRENLAYEKGTKNTSFATNVKASQILRNHNVFIMGSHAYGHPTHTEDVLNDVAKYGQIYSDLFKASIYAPLGIDIMHESAKNHYKGKMTWEYLVRKYYLMLLLYWINPKTISRMFFHKNKLHRRLMRKAYLAQMQYAFWFPIQRLLRINS